MKVVMSLLTAGIATACAPVHSPVIVAPMVKTVPGTDTIPIPLPQLASRTYHGLAGGLFPGGLNIAPAEHDAAGIAHRNLIRPLSVNGIPGGAGRYVLLSVGSSEESAAWCSQSSAPPCDSWSFTGKAVSDPEVNHSALVIVNGAMPGAGIGHWSNATDSNYVRIRDTRLAPLGLSENQVQAIWLHLDQNPLNLPLVAARTDATAQMEELGAVIHALRSRYPNVQQIFISSASYGGDTGELASYESGFVVKWIVESQLASLPITTGPSAIPWLGWGPYLWVRGDRPTVARTASMLFDFFKTSPYTRCWFLAGPVCG